MCWIIKSRSPFRVYRSLKFFTAHYMGPLDLINHLFNFLAPALVVGWLLALLAPLLMRSVRPARSWLAQGALNALAGVTAMGLGLWFFGNDGKMASYGLLVVLVASSQWLAGKGWKA